MGKKPKRDGVFAICWVAFEHNGSKLSCGGAPIWRMLGGQLKEGSRLLHVFQVDGNETVVIVSGFPIETYNEMAEVLGEPPVKSDYKLRNLASGSIRSAHEQCRQIGGDVQEYKL